MVWFAFSVEDQVEKYGAYVGIAAFFGLAVLSLLYFSQARELKRLREWAGRAPERARELEERVVAQATATVARRPAAMPTSAPAGGIAPPRRLAEMPAPAARTAAGAQATELAEAVDADPATNGNVPAAPRLGPGGTVPAGPPVKLGPGGTVPAGPPANGTGDATRIAPAPANGSGAPEAPAEPAAPPADEPGEREPTVPGEIPAAAVPRVTPAQRVGVTPKPEPMPLRQAQPSATPRGGQRRPPAPAKRRPAPSKPAGGGQGRSAGTIALLVGLAVLILGGGVFLASQVLGGGEDDTPPQGNQTAPPPTETQQPDGGGNAAAQPSAPADTNVAVLNGTTSQGLAGTLADQLAAEGYQRGVVETNTRDQTIAETTIFYADGERATARAVGKILGVDKAEPLDPETESLAPEADIVVLAGADQAP